jgi:glutamate dehydrogenase
VVELITDDMPFLVDTLTMLLAETGHAVQLIAHPILQVVRGRSGQLLHVGERSRRKGQQPHSESWQYLRIDRITDEQERAALRARLLAALTDVRNACDDWQAMRRTARELCALLTQRPPHLAPGIAAEAASLLAYMEDNHFTFLGYQRYRVRRGTRLEAVAGSGLGIVRTGRRRRSLSADRAAKTGRRELLAVSKSDRRSTVHRPGYLDCVAVRDFDRRGRLIGEVQFLGLWTSNTYHADPRTVPLLRLKVARVIASFKFRASSHDGKRLVSILDGLPRDELFQATVAELRQCARAVLELHERARGVCLVLRRDSLRRFWSCLVYLGRERLDNDAFRRLEQVLRHALGGGQLDSSLAVGDAPLAQLHITVRTPAAARTKVNRRALERELNEAMVTWRDRLRLALRARYDETEATAFERRYGQAFPAAYRQDVAPALAVQDIADFGSAGDRRGAGAHASTTAPPR